MAEHVPGTVHSLAFSLDGSRLWCAHRSQIAVRAWPSLELLALHALPTTRLMATVDGTFLCATEHEVHELSEALEVQRSIETQGTVGLGLTDDGAIVVARTGDALDVLVERYDGEGVPTLWGRFPGHAWWALLPTKKALIGAVDGNSPLHFDVATGQLSDQWRWPPRWRDRGVEGSSQRSWLSVDVAPDERCVIASDKGQNTAVIWLDEIGRVTRLVCLDPLPGPTPPSFQKGPRRGAAATVHPHDDVAVSLDISGQLRVHDASSGRLLEVVEGLFRGGYRWEGVR
jgi:hypothetical protein